MKTNFKTTVLAIALMVGTTGAFAKNISNALSTKSFVNYEWQKFDKSGNLIDSKITTSTDNPFPEDCNGDQELCARGRVQGTTPYTISYFYPAQ